MNSRSSAVVGVFIFCLITVVNAEAQVKWELLGEKTVDRTLDLDVIHLNNNEIYTSLKVEVKQGAINIYKTIVHFKTGETQTVSLPETLSQGDEGLIDLKDNKRVIVKITFWYDTKGSVAEKAVIKIWARK